MRANTDRVRELVYYYRPKRPRRKHKNNVSSSEILEVSGVGLSLLHRSRKPCASLERL